MPVDDHRLADARTLRNAAAVVAARANPRSWTGRLLVSYLVKTLRYGADRIEVGKGRG